jgi:glycosyltransferase involved in cell wall biosynthesis
MGSPRTGSVVKVALLSYQRGHYLREALLSLLGQSRLPEEIHVLDNGSDPSVLAAVEDLIGGRVFFEPSDTNRGVHWNSRRAYSLVGFDYLYVMHDDDRLKPFFLEEQVRFLEENPSVVAVGCDAEVIGPHGEPVRSRLLRGGSRAEAEFFPALPDMVRLYVRSYMVFPSVVYRAPGPGPEAVQEEWGQVGDVVLLCELARRGPLAFLNRPLMEYRLHFGQDSGTFRESNRQKLDAYFRERAEEYPELRYEVERYMRRRRWYRPVKKLGEWVRRHRFR